MSRQCSQNLTSILIGLLFSASPVVADVNKHATEKLHDTSVFTSSLEVKPSSCVALHRGQACYQEVALSWAVVEAGQYCLFDDSEGLLLHCVSGYSGHYKLMYSSETSITYTLRQGKHGPVIAQASVRTSWVYRTGRRSSSGWRLF